MATHRSRRSFVRATAGLASVAAVGSTAGCQSVPLVGGGGELNSVPADADGVMYADVAAVLDDEGVRTVANAWYEARSESRFYDGPASYDEALSQFEAETDLDVQGLNEIVAFGAYGGEYGLVDGDYGAFILAADWTVDDVIDSLEETNDANYDEDERAGQPIYEPEADYDSYVGVLSDDRIVVGQEDAVEDTIDADQGDNDGLSDDIGSAYSNARSGAIRFGSTMPDPDEYDSIPESYGRGDDQVSLGVLEDVKTVAGAIYADGETRGVEVTMTADDADTGENLADIVTGAITYAEDSTEDEQALALLEDIEVQQNGVNVTLTFERTVGELEDLVEATLG